MLLGVKTKKEAFLRHLVVGVIAGVLVYFVWSVNSSWSPDMRLWKSFGGAAFFLLWFALFVGPAARLFKPLNRIVSWRREAGVWFFIISSVHGYLVLNGWVRWDLWQLIGFQYIEQLDMYVRMEPGFGLANLMGLTAWFFALLLSATSFDKAVSFLGISSWKWLHTFAYVIFYVSALHALYYAFIHFKPSLSRIAMGLPYDYPENPLRFYYLFLFLSVFLVQILAFTRSVYKQRKKI